MIDAIISSGICFDKLVYWFQKKLDFECKGWHSCQNPLDGFPGGTTLSPIFQLFVYIVVLYSSIASNKRLKNTNMKHERRKLIEKCVTSSSSTSTSNHYLAGSMIWRSQFFSQRYVVSINFDIFERSAIHSSLIFSAEVCHSIRLQCDSRPTLVEPVYLGCSCARARVPWTFLWYHFALCRIIFFIMAIY